MKTTNKKKILIITIGILITLGIVIGVSYAWWTHTVSQEGINTIQSTCLEIVLEDENPISLQNAYPITDTEASLLIPYSFIIKNKCNTMLEYDVNLDIMESKVNNVDNRLSSSYIAIEFNGGEKRLLSTLESVETSYPREDYKPVEGRYLTSGSLGSNESKTYTIKLWLDESVTVEDDAMNKNFISKVVVTAKQSHAVRLADMVNLGDYVEMTPTSTSYTIPTSMTGYSTNQSINPSELNLWRVIRKNEDGTIEMISEYVSSTTVYLSGLTGYLNLVATLQNIAAQYENNEFTVSAKHFGFNGQTYSVPAGTPSVCGAAYNSTASSWNPTLESKGCGDSIYRADINLVISTIGTLTANSVKSNTVQRYWVCGRQFYSQSNDYALYTNVIDVDGCLKQNVDGLNNFLYNPNGNKSRTIGYSIRPIITLKTNILYESGDGNIENPFKMS